MSFHASLFFFFFLRSPLLLLPFFSLLIHYYAGSLEGASDSKRFLSQTSGTVQLQYLHTDVLWPAGDSYGAGLIHKTEELPRLASFDVETVGDNTVRLRDVESSMWVCLHRDGSLVTDTTSPSLCADFAVRIDNNKVYLQGYNGRWFKIHSDGSVAAIQEHRKALELEEQQLSNPSRIRSVCLGGWLVIEGWIQPSLFDGIPDNDLLDGAQIQFQSVTLGTYVSAEGGGGQDVVVNIHNASGWETFRIWRVDDGSYQLRVFGNQFISAESGGGGKVTAYKPIPSTQETFEIVRSPTDSNRVHIRVQNGMYMQAINSSQLTADFSGEPNWDNNPATFQMTILKDLALHGEFQLANGYGPSRAPAVFQQHRNSFVTEDDFEYLSNNGINAVRIPVGWWLASDPNPPPPYVGGSLQVLDNAFDWGRNHGIYIIVDLHAAPGSQNGQEHSSSRDGSSEWAQTGTDNIIQTIAVIDFLASRYATQPAFLGLELLNEPFASVVPLDTLVSYYTQGYQTVRKYSSSCYVLMCQRIAADPHELVGVNNGLDKVVLDLHYYSLFSDGFDDWTAQQNIDFINNKRATELRSLNSANGLLTFVGEWVNEWKVPNASKDDYEAFGNAQLTAYANASLGWSYWTMRNAEEHWNFKWNVQEGYLQQRPGGGWP